MDENKHNKANHNLVTSENTILLPPSFTNNKTPVSPAPQQAKQNKKELLRASSLLFDHIEGHINLADTKAQLILAADALLALAFALLIKGVAIRLFANATPILDRFVALFTLGMFITLVCSFFFALLVVRPFLRSSQPTSLMYFGQIAQMSEKDFIETFQTQTLDKLKEAVLTEVHAKATIAKRKFKRIRYSIDFLIASLVLWTVVQLLQAFGR